MACYTPDEAEIIVFDPRRKLIGVVPDDWPSRYVYTPDAIRATVDGDPATGAPGLVDVFKQRTPPPGTSQADLLKLRFWKGREIFIICDDATSWRPSESPLARLAPWVQQADHLGFHIIATADITKWGVEAATSGVLGKIAESLAPIYVMSGHSQYGRIVGDLRSEPQRPGKGVLWTPAGMTGALTARSDPPASE
jgi:S-DNA-T family DNA segregation ATPase FtsK/SpoIIIE